MYKLRNMMEALVLQTIDRLAEKEGFCNCSRCRLDIASLTLNRLPPRYVVTSRGEVYSRADFLGLQQKVDIIGTILEAVKIVERDPRH